MIKVPDDKDKNVLKLLELINSADPASYVKVEPEAYAIVSNCFPTVELKIQKDGGKIIFGWQIWQSENFVEAEFHGIWESEDGIRVDITPKSIAGIDKILFVPDGTMIYEGKQTNNIRINTTNNALVDDFIKLWNAKFEIENKGDRASEHDFKKLGLSYAEVTLYNKIVDTANGINIMLDKNNNRESKCFCGSGVKYKQCHGKVLLELRK
jgi:hypothetical protein